MDNIIRLSFGDRDYILVDQRTRHDYGQVILFEDLDLPFAFEVFFANERDRGKAKKAVGQNNSVLIPDEYFKSGNPIYGWIFVHPTVDSGNTEKKFCIKIDSRPEADPEEATPVQQDIIAATIAALDAAVEQTGRDTVSTGQSAIDAAASAASASTSEENAATYADYAHDSEQNALAYKNDAAGFATNAGIAADSADKSAEDAEAYAIGKRNGVSVPSSDVAYENNAKYYSEIAEYNSTLAGEYADNARQSAAESGYMFFYIDSDGYLVYQRTSNVDVNFYLQDGYLYMGGVS